MVPKKTEGGAPKGTTSTENTTEITTRDNNNPIYGKDPNMGRNIPLMMQQLQKQQMQMQNMNYNIQQKSMYQQQMRPNNQYIQNKEEVIQMKNEIKEGDVNQNFFNSKSSSESDKAFN